MMTTTTSAPTTTPAAAAAGTAHVSSSAPSPVVEEKAESPSSAPASMITATTTTTSYPRNPLVRAMLTDLYQLTMTYAYWKTQRHNDDATFELFFRKNPFEGQYTVFCGLDECLKYLAHLEFTRDDARFLKDHVPNFAHVEDGFWDYLTSLNASSLNVYALPEGSLVFPRIPMIVVQGPLAVAQLVETTLLTLVNYPSLVATNAARMVRAAQAKTTGAASSSTPPPAAPAAAQFAKIPTCVEFGLRRAQGPDGGVSASHYAHLGGFVATSNVLAGQLSGVPLSGTHAHAFVQTFASLDEAQHENLIPNPQKAGSEGENAALLPRALRYQKEFAERHDPAFLRTHPGELAAFCAYAAAFPNHFLCLVDTYDTLRSGLLNFVVVASVLDDLGYEPVGIRLDSGNLAELSVGCAHVFARHAADDNREFFHRLSIVASNDINEASIHELNRSGHAITAYGIGTNLVTCEKQPALGCVYKLVELNGTARIKISQDAGKVLIPGAKRAYRLYGNDGQPILDLLTRHDESPPVPGQPVECCSPFGVMEATIVTPSRVEPLLRPVFCQGKVVFENVRTLSQARLALAEEINEFPPDVLLLENPSPFKVFVSRLLYAFLHEMWAQSS